MNELVKVEQAVEQQPTAMSIIQQAVLDKASPELLEKLMDLQERFEANEARKAYVKAMAAFKANPPKIIKDRTVDFTSAKGRTHYNHASLANVSDAVNMALSRHGLNARGLHAVRQLPQG